MIDTSRTLVPGSRAEQTEPLELQLLSTRRQRGHCCPAPHPGPSLCGGGRSCPAPFPLRCWALRHRALSGPAPLTHARTARSPHRAGCAGPPAPEGAAWHLSRCSALPTWSSSASRGQSPPSLFPSLPQAGQLPAGGRLLPGPGCAAAAGPRLSCLDLSDNELRAQGVLQLCQQLRHPACPLRSLGLSTDGFSQALLQELDALRALQPGLNIGNLLEHDLPQAGAMARLPCHRGVLPGSRKALPSFRRPPIL
ncbi:uncharacterized protein LOC131084885 [Melospiza georgiana]|uniref:uncharacterized protein LOC131084885 n=1 Tax=Melospiza georgiana TaxID=44398 RepID=UPI0025ACBC5D|nr:uncharacterized protein LOC131084885 [Melospiza georgiana]